MTTELNESERFVSSLATLALDGEIDDEGREFHWESDDAWQTLESLIEHAREIVSHRNTRY